MKRKVSKVGPATLMVSLPSKWAKQFNVKKGNEIEVIEEGNKLVLCIAKVSESKKIEINLSKHSSLLRRYVMDAYRSGFDEVRFIYQNPKDIEIIQKTSNEILIGYEIIEQGKDSCILRSITKDSEEEFDNLFRRIFLVTSIMAKNSLEAIKKSDFELLKEAHVLEVTNNKFVLYCERILNKKGNENFLKTNFTFAIVYQLEKIADEFKEICEYLGKNKIKLSSEIIKLYEKVSHMFELCQRLCYNFSENDAELLTALRDQILDDAYNFFKKTNKNEAKILSNIVNITKLIYNILGCKISLTLSK